MKYAKTIGVSLTTLACILAFGLKPAYAPPKEIKKDPDVVKVVDTLKQIEGMFPSYETPDGKKINVYWDGGAIENGKKREYLELNVSKNSQKGEVVIRDYNYDNLDSKDEISYETTHIFTTIPLPSITERKKMYFSELSSETQKELTKEYNKIIKEAPGKLLQAYKEYQQKTKQQQMKDKEDLEKNIMNILK